MAKAIVIFMALVSAARLGAAYADDQQQTFGFGDNPSLNTPGIATQAGTSAAASTLHSFDNINVQVPVTGVQVSGVRVPQVFSAVPLVPAQNAYSPAMVPAAYDPYAAQPVGAAQYPSAQLPQAARIPEAAQLPETQYPVTRLPAAQYPAAQLPVAQIPETQIPDVQYPAAQYPATQLPAAQLPGTQLPSSQFPAAPYPAAQAPEAPEFSGVPGTDNQTDIYYPEQERGGQEE